MTALLAALFGSWIGFLLGYVVRGVRARRNELRITQELTKLINDRSGNGP